MKSNFLGGAYSVRSLPLSAQTCVNLYSEVNESGQGEIGAFYGTPGLRKLLTLTGPHRASVVANGALYVLAGDTITKLSADLTPTFLGTITSSSGPAKMAFNLTQVCVAHPDGWAVIETGTDVVTNVPAAPKTCDISFIDNYGVFANDNGTYGWTELANFSTLNPLSFASAEGSPDKVLRTVADHRELWLFGEQTVEIAQVGSDPDLPFTRTAFIEHGILAPHSAVKQDNSVFWLGRNESGQGCVYRADGYTPQRVSTFAIEYAIAGYANPENCTAFTYQQDGHHFVVFNFEEATWCYDINLNAWHQRAWREPATGDLKRHRAQTHVMFGNRHMVGDWEDGRLYALDLDYFFDDTDLIYRERTWAQQDAENHRIIYHRGELIADMGVGLDGDVPEDWKDPAVWLSWSNDGGRTWSSELKQSLGKIGQFLNRCVWWRMGTARTRYYHMRSTAPVRHVWRSFNFQAEVASK